MAVQLVKVDFLGWGIAEVVWNSHVKDDVCLLEPLDLDATHHRGFVWSTQRDLVAIVGQENLNMREVALREKLGHGLESIQGVSHVVAVRVLVPCVEHLGTLEPEQQENLIFKRN